MPNPAAASPRIILASQSPSRLSILRSAGVEPLVHPASVDEDAIVAAMPGAEPSSVVLALAEAKAQAIAPEHPHDIVVGGDSMLLLDGQLQGKPHDVPTTIERWKQQRGRSATLITGHHLTTPRGSRSVASTTEVHFGEPTDADIEAYARSGEPLQCAGAFTIEAMGGWFIDAIEGDPSGVIGLSLPAVRRALYELGYEVAQLWQAHE